jgi:hypothetical protein
VDLDPVDWQVQEVKYVICDDCKNAQRQVRVSSALDGLSGRLDNTDSYLEKVIDHFGPSHQIMKAIDEMAELTSALVRYQNQAGWSTLVIDEIADVLIMARQLRLIFGPELVDGRMRFKLDRLDWVMERERDQRLTNEADAPGFFGKAVKGLGAEKSKN